MEDLNKIMVVIESHNKMIEAHSKIMMKILNKILIKILIQRKLLALKPL